MKRQIILSALVILFVLSFPIFSWAECQADLNNDVTKLAEYPITTGWWPGSAILSDGTVTN